MWGRGEAGQGHYLGVLYTSISRSWVFTHDCAVVILIRLRGGLWSSSESRC